MVIAEIGERLSEPVVQTLLVVQGWFAEGPAVVAQRLSVDEPAASQILEVETTEDWAGHRRWSSMTFVFPASKCSRSSSQTRRQHTQHPCVRRVDRAACWACTVIQCRGKRSSIVCKGKGEVVGLQMRADASCIRVLD